MKFFKILTPTLAFIALAPYIVFKNPAIFGLCEIGDYYCEYSFNGWERIFSFAPYFVIVALISLFLSDRYFRNWWRFAWWGGPLTIGVIILVNAGFHHTGGGFMNLDTILDDEIVFLVYLFFGVGSLVQFWRTYKQVK